jgi:DNA-binding response OmpR family regulator
MATVPPVVLIVSDDISKLSILRNVLQTSTHLVERDDLPSALELLKMSSVDVVILDSGLDNPIDTAKQLRSVIAKVDTPILMITSNLKKSFINEALQVGVTDFINEPLDKDEIEQRLAVAYKATHRSQAISRIGQRSTHRGRAPKKDLAQRELYDSQAIRAIEKASEKDSTISLLMIELDDCSIPEGIPHLTAILEKNIRTNDLLIPQAPGKFILIFTKASKRAAEIIAETIRYEVAMMPLLTVSIGIVNLEGPGQGNAADVYKHLIKAVSHSFEKAKKFGNRIISS